MEPSGAALKREDLTVHILTKVFIVLVSMLAVLLVPLVVVYAHNEDSYKAKYQEAETLANANQADLDAAKLSHANSMAAKEIRIADLLREAADLQTDVDRRGAEIRDLERRLVSAEGMQTQIVAKLTRLVSTVEAGHELNESLITELRTIRGEALAAERRQVDLDEELREVSGQLEVAVAARRALQEELHRLSEEHAKAMSSLSHYEARIGALSDVPDLTREGIAPTHNVNATVIGVRRDQDRILAEIDAGSRDRLREGWVGTIGHGGTFVAKIRIISVDINRSTGLVTLESKDRGKVEIGNRVYFRAGSR